MRSFATAAQRQQQDRLRKFFNSMGLFPSHSFESKRQMCLPLDPPADSIHFNEAILLNAHSHRRTRWGSGGGGRPPF